MAKAIISSSIESPKAIKYFIRLADGAFLKIASYKNITKCPPSRIGIGNKLTKQSPADIEANNERKGTRPSFTL